MADGSEETFPQYFQDKRVRSGYAAASQVSRWNEERLYGFELHAPEPDQMSVAALAVVHEHQRSATVLVREGLMGSATALMRPSFEAFVRGLWLQWANDDELARFQKGHDTATPDKIIRVVVKRSGIERYKGLMDTWQQSERTLHGYVHHGYQSLIRRAGVIDTDPSEVVELLRFSTSMALHASLEILELADNRARESERAVMRKFVNERQLEIVAMLRTMGLVQMPGDVGPTPPTLASGAA